MGEQSLASRRQREAADERAVAFGPGPSLDKAVAEDTRPRSGVIGVLGGSLNGADRFASRSKRPRWRVEAKGSVDQRNMVGCDLHRLDAH